LLPASALRHSATATAERLGGPGTWLLALAPHHIAGVQVLVRSLLAGTRPEVLDLAQGFTAEAFVDATGRLSARAPGRRYTAVVPTQLLRLLDAGGPAVEALASYEAVLVGGAATAPSLLDRARASGARVVTTYGMSETCGGCVYDGRPLSGVRVRVGADGRIRVGGPVLFSGYRLRPVLTAATLLSGELVTNDLGRIDADGRLAVLGRADEIVVTGGENVALAAVEAALAEHPAVREAAALGVADPEWGQRLVAVVVPFGRMPALAELRQWVAERAGRAAAPREVLAAVALPLLGPGKLDRAALRTLVEARGALARSASPVHFPHDRVRRRARDTPR